MGNPVKLPTMVGGAALTQDDLSNYAPPTTRTMLANIEKELSRSPLEEIYARLAKLTYGEMKQFAEEVGGDADKIWEKASA